MVKFISKKLIHYNFRLNKLVSKLTLYLIGLILFSKNLIFCNNFLFNVPYFFIQNSNYCEFYNLKFVIKAKHLFLFTIYIIFTKLAKVINLFFFKFNNLVKKQKKITVLRAPCNDKNSKEQFGVDTYSGKLVSFQPFKYNKYFANYIFNFFYQNTNFGLSLLNHIIKRNETKFIK